MTGVQTFALPIWGPAGNGDRRFGPWRVIIAVGDDARAIADTPRHDVRRIGECRPIERLHDFGARAETNLGRRAFIALVISRRRSEEHTSELQSLMRISYAVFCLKKKTNKIRTTI